MRFEEFMQLLNGIVNDVKTGRAEVSAKFVTFNAVKRRTVSHKVSIEEVLEFCKKNQNNFITARVDENRIVAEFVLNEESYRFVVLELKPKT